MKSMSSSTRCASPAPSMRWYRPKMVRLARGDRVSMRTFCWSVTPSRRRTARTLRDTSMPNTRTWPLVGRVTP